jgi:uncharacterized protein YdhG (YjbR/CyaY superfamily)
MAKTDFSTVDEYIALQPKATQTALKRVRNVIRKALPGVEEVISYRIAAFRLRGRIVIYMAGWKDHYSLYPFTDRLLRELGKDVAPYKSGKGTLRFEPSEPVPEKLIARIARSRARENAEQALEREREKAAKRKARNA